MGMLKLTLLLIMIVSASIKSYAETLSNLHINSTDLVIDRVKMTAIFTGSVVLCFQDVKLLGAEVIFHFEDEKIKDIKYIHISKNIRAIQNLDNTLLIADEAIFEMKKSELNLMGNVVIQKDDKIMKAKEMVYYGKINNVMLEK